MSAYTPYIIQNMIFNINNPEGYNQLSIIYSQVTKAQAHPPELYSHGQTHPINHFYCQGQNHKLTYPLPNSINSNLRVLSSGQKLTPVILRAKQSYDRKSVSYEHKSATLPPNHGESSFFSQKINHVKLLDVLRGSSPTHMRVRGT